MSRFYDMIAQRLGRFLARRLEETPSGFVPYTHANVVALRQVLQPGDVLLVEGHARISQGIKYLTQSTWSHAALYVGNAVGRVSPTGEPLSLIEVDLAKGCIAVPLSKYEYFNTRICRASHLTVQDKAEVVDFMIRSLGKKYDLKNIADMLRFLIPTPPIPVRWRRRMLSFGSGDPTRAICSSLIAEAFQKIKYPVLPKITKEFRADSMARNQRREILHIRHHSLYAPRDFDLSPYFHIIKPTLEAGFNYRNLVWSSKTIGADGEDATEGLKKRQM
ncbi:YiiX/YebB-like N1pC/P60 family cysteine hydrolase [Amaricoccus tamworthensis]|uniref:YiiX/YebB-like N1pC/P60 family cysteine hydrolase n=1 Tax=Amaricoccus tamworthensis TaxID=57002 RepID=UPI003C7E8A76